MKPINNRPKMSAVAVVSQMADRYAGCRIELTCERLDLTDHLWVVAVHRPTPAGFECESVHRLPVSRNVVNAEPAIRRYLVRLLRVSARQITYQHERSARKSSISKVRPSLKRLNRFMSPN